MPEEIIPAPLRHSFPDRAYRGHGGGDGQFGPVTLMAGGDETEFGQGPYAWGSHPEDFKNALRLSVDIVRDAFPNQGDLEWLKRAAIVLYTLSISQQKRHRFFQVTDLEVHALLENLPAEEALPKAPQLSREALAQKSFLATLAQGE